MTEKTILLPSHTPHNGGEIHYRLTATTAKRRYLSYLRERWWVVLICLAVAVGGTVTYETLRPETYTSIAQLYASGQAQLNFAAVFNDEESQTYYGTQIELLKSVRLQSAAVQKIGFTPTAKQRSPANVDVIRPMGTSILILQATGLDPELSKRFLQALIDEYLAYKKEIRNSTSEDLVNSLTDQLAGKEKDLKAEQEKWVEFQKTNNVAVLEEEGKSAGLYLADLNLQMAKLNLDRELLANGLNPAGRRYSGSQPGLSATNSASGQPGSAFSESDENSKTNAATVPSGDATLKSYRVELAVKRAERERALAEHGQRAAEAYDDVIRRLEKTVSVFEAQDLAERNASLSELVKRIAAIRASIPSWESNVLNLNERLAESQRLRNNIKREEDFYDHLLAMLQNVDLSKNIQQERLSILQSPTNGIPVERYFAFRIVLTIIFGLFLGLGIVFCWYLLDDRFVSVRDLKEQFGEPILGLVPRVRIPRSKPDAALLKADDPRRAYAESYRHLRSALLLSSLGQSRPQALLFTGAAPGEGKTTVAVNLARVLARSGLRVVLVDVDPLGKGIHRLMNSSANPGVLDYLRGEAEIKAILQPTDQPGLRLIPKGAHADHGEGLFLQPRFAELMAGLKGDCDFVILDGAPILSADDAAMLVPQADAIVLVLRPFFTRSRQVRQTLDMLYQRQAKQVTIVFNHARAEDLAGHYAQNDGLPVSGNGASTKKPVVS